MVAVDFMLHCAKTWRAMTKETGVTRYAAVPMNAAEWRQGLADLARQAREADAEDQADFLRVARTLMGVAEGFEIDEPWHLAPALLH